MTTPLGWTRKTLQDFIKLQRGFDLPQSKRREGTYRVLTSGATNGWHDEGPVAGPGFVVGRATNLGRPTWSEEDFWPLNTTLFAKDFLGNDPKFAYFWFLGNDLSGFNSGSVQPMLNRNYIANVPIDVPPLEEQVFISNFLSSIENSVDSNLRASQLCLDLAQATYEAAASEASKNSLGDIAKVVLGGTPDRSNKQYWTNGDVPWINSGSANQNIILKPTSYITSGALENSSAKIMPKGASVMAITGATLGQVALLGIETAGNQSLVGVWSETESLSCWLHFALRSSVAEVLKSATGAAQQHVNKQNIEELLVPMLNAGNLRLWSDTAIPLMELAVQHAEQANLATDLKTALLPELLSGRIRLQN